MNGSDRINEIIESIIAKSEDRQKALEDALIAIEGAKQELSRLAAMLANDNA